MGNTGLRGARLRTEDSREAALIFPQRVGSDSDHITGAAVRQSHTARREALCPRATSAKNHALEPPTLTTASAALPLLARLTAGVRLHWLMATMT